MKTLYQEAIADAKKLKEIAEDNAKKALVEAVTPRIKEFIEKQLLDESTENDEEDEDDLLLDEEPTNPLLSGDDLSHLSSNSSSLAQDNKSVEDGGDSIPVVDDDGKITLDLDTIDVDDDDEIDVTPDVKTALSKMSESKKILSRVSQIAEDIKSANSVTKILSESTGFFEHVDNIISSIMHTYKQVRESKINNADKILFCEKLEKLFQDIKGNKAMKRRRLSEEDVTLKLTGLPDDLDLSDVSVDLITGDSDDDEELDFDAEDEGSDDEELDFDAEDEGSDDEELDFGDEGDSDDDEELELEADDMSGDEQVIEIDESVLRREISRMRTLRESRSRRVTPRKTVREEKHKGMKLGHGTKGTYDNFGDADEEGEPLEIDPLKRMLARENRKISSLKRRYTSLSKFASGSLNESKNNGAIRDRLSQLRKSIVESTARVKKLEEALKNKARTNNARPSRNNLEEKLSESKLFNAKLAYANKLLQNESLTRTQKAEAIKKLDETKTIREAKLVYETLAKALEKPKKKINESTRVVGSSSRPAGRPSGVLSESVETDRWAKLAGLK
jgi:hypothetical protein